MPQGEGTGRAPPAAGIDVLPDEALQHILGFLEAQESVRTCVLARRWRHLWKSAMDLRIVADEDEFLGSVEKLCGFVDSLLQLRGGSPLDTFDLMFTSFGRNMSDCLSEDGGRLLTSVNNWFRHAVSCQVRVLSLYAFNTGSLDFPSLVLYDLPVNSEHLTRLELGEVVVDSRFLNFSNCPSLQHLEFQTCSFGSVDDPPRVHIYAPHLVSLRIVWIWSMIPVLESMPSLVKAVIVTSVESMDTCDHHSCNCEFCANSYSIGDGTDSNGCVLLNGLSEAKDLALISGPQMFIFKRDLRWCPVFSKLKTLLLNDYWCVPDDFRALGCMLQHSPVLEKLTLHLSSNERRPQRERTGNLRPMEGSAAISEHLKIIEVKSDAVDERICKLTLFLCAFPIRKLACYILRAYLSEIRRNLYLRERKQAVLKTNGHSL